MHSLLPSMPHFWSKGHADEASTSSAKDLKETQRIEIVVDNPYLTLRGHGSDVEPGVLSGTVALCLAEATDLRSVTLEFRGEAYLPLAVTSSQDAFIGDPPTEYVFCHHKWSFLEGGKKHNHTLKAGRHLFRFELQVGGSLPCSIATDIGGGAGIVYKLRAVAHRAGLSHNLQCVIPVHCIRALVPDALEYQQTRDVESLWRDQLMMSVAMPHCAWGVGDEFVSLLKVSRLVKGAGLLSATITLKEKTHIFDRTTSFTRPVASVSYDIVGNKAVPVAPGTPGRSNSRSSGDRSITHHHGSPSPSIRASTSSARPEANTSSSESGHSTADFQDDEHTELSIPLRMRIPLNLTPSHTLVPLKIEHTMYWTLTVMSASGDILDLSCHMNVQLLDTHLLKEVRSHTRAARKLLVGSSSSPLTGEDDPNYLPSYMAHVRDRVANIYLTDTNSMRVPNPWLILGSEPIPNSDHDTEVNARAMEQADTEIITDVDSDDDEEQQYNRNPVAIDWANSELMISQGLTRLSSPTPSADELSLAGSGRSISDHPSPTMVQDIPTYTHNTHHNAAGLFTIKMESAKAHSHWPAIPQRYEALGKEAVKEMADPNPHSPLRTELEPTLLPRAFVEVPTYDSAVHAFCGAVPPLTSLQGLPSYQEAAQSPV